MVIDVGTLRRDLLDYFGTAAASGLGPAVLDLARVESASPEELAQIATEQGFDLGKYQIEKDG